MIWDLVLWCVFLLVSYVFGGIPTAYLAGRLVKGQDIRDVGDRNSGAANVFRNVGPKAGLAVGAIDIAKGGAAVLLTKAALDSQAAEMVSGLLVVAGHNWSPFLGMRGGRGAATAVGVLMAMLPMLAIPVAISALAVLWFTRKAIMALAYFLVLMALLAWAPFFDYSSRQSAYALLIPVMIGVCHVISVRRLAAPDPAR